MISILGDLFVGALRGIAPLLVFFLVMSSLCHMGKGQKTNMKLVVVLYLLGNVLSALAAVISSRLFPIMLTFFRKIQILPTSLRQAVLQRSSKTF